MNPGARRATRVLLYIAVGMAMVLVARQVDWRAAATAVRDADPWFLVLAALLNLLSLVLKGVRWWVFLRPCGVQSLGLVLRATFAGASLNNLLVAQGGEGARVVMISRASRVASARVLAAVALDRLLDAASYLVFLVSAAWLLALPAIIARWRIEATLALGGLAVLLVLLVLLARRGGARANDVPPGGAAVVEARPSSRQRVVAYVRHFGGSVAEIASPQRLVAGMVLSLAAWALQVATYHIVAIAAGAHLPLAGSVGAQLAVGISFLVRATPGNVGVFQMVYAMTARSFGIVESVAVGVAVMIQIVQVGPVLLVGLIGHWATGTRAGELRDPG